MGLLIVFLGFCQVTLDRADGTNISGDWVSISDKSVVLASGSGDKAIPIEAVSQIVRDDATQVSAAPTYVGLTDGCELRVRSVTFEGKELELVLAGYRGSSSSLKVPVNVVRWIRFRKPVNEGINTQWLSRLKANQPSDLLIVHASNDKLDEAPGTILNITSDRVGFSLGGQNVDAPRSRLEGVVFRGAVVPPPRVKAKVIDEAGSVWMATEFSGAGEEVQLKTKTGITRELALSAIHVLELMGDAKLLLASDAAESSFSAFVGGLLDPNYAASLFGPQDTEDGLLMSSGANVVVRLDGESSFEANVESVAQIYSGTVELLIRSGDETLLKESLLTTDLPKKIKVNVKGRRRLEISVSAAGDSATGDILLLRRARLSQ